MPEIRVDDTICAIATASGEAALSVVRLSGPKTFEIADRIFRARSGKKLNAAAPFTVHTGWLTDAGQSVDECLATVFRAPKSFTAEDVVEFSTHGGRQAAEAVLRLCIRSGARPAEPGEFTRRAFLNGRVDLTQAEAVIDIIHASSDRSLRQAVLQLEGQLSKKVHALKDRLLHVAAHIEAYVDFPEEDHDVFSNEEFRAAFRDVRGELEELLASFTSGKLVRDGLLCVLVGRPNVGKSSLLNALLGEDRAIVTEVPGTTRDTIEERVVINGITVRLVDTAGLGTPKDAIDRMGMDRTRKYFQHADLFLWLTDGSSALGKEDLEIYKNISARPVIWVINKSDLPQKINADAHAREIGKISIVRVSARTPSGLDDLKKEIMKSVLREEARAENAHLTRERHRSAVADALAHTRRAEEAFEKKTSLEFLASDVRNALRALGELVGEIYTDDLLDVIFKEFCVGK